MEINASVWCRPRRSIGKRPIQSSSTMSPPPSGHLGSLPLFSPNSLSPPPHFHGKRQSENLSSGAAHHATTTGSHLQTAADARMARCYRNLTVVGQLYRCHIPPVCCARCQPLPNSTFLPTGSDQPAPEETAYILQPIERFGGMSWPGLGRHGLHLGASFLVGQ